MSNNPDGEKKKKRIQFVPLQHIFSFIFLEYFRFSIHFSFSFVNFVDFLNGHTTNGEINGKTWTEKKLNGIEIINLVYFIYTQTKIYKLNWFYGTLNWKTKTNGKYNSKWSKKIRETKEFLLLFEWKEMAIRIHFPRDFFLRHMNFHNYDQNCLASHPKYVDPFFVGIWNRGK